MVKKKNYMNRKELDGLEMFIAGLSGENPSDLIPEQEKRGQELFIEIDVLPKEITGGTKEDLEAMGVVFGEDNDDLFVNVQLPGGWKKEVTEHDMWSRLLDDQGNEIAMIFYKAAFYDRRASLSLTPPQEDKND